MDGRLPPVVRPLRRTRIAAGRSVLECLLELAMPPRLRLTLAPHHQRTGGAGPSLCRLARGGRPCGVRRPGA